MWGCVLAFQRSLPTPTPYYSVSMESRGLFLDAHCWICSAVTFALCSWEFLGQKVRLYLGRAPARVKFHLATPVVPQVDPKPRRRWSCQGLTAL